MADPGAPMATFRIACRIHEIAPRHYEARVLVLAVDEPGPGLAERSECRIFESRELATSECARMAEAMEHRLVQWGHKVIAVADP